MYSFTKTLVAKWSVKAYPYEIVIDPETEQKLCYYRAFLDNKQAFGVLEGHHNRNEPVSGLAQQFTVLTVAPDDRLKENTLMWLLDSKEALNPFPVIEKLVPNHIGLLRRAKYDDVFNDFPFINGCKVYSMPPQAAGIAFSCGRIETGGMYLIFRSDDMPEGLTEKDAIHLEIYMRGIVYVQNH